MARKQKAREKLNWIPVVGIEQGLSICSGQAALVMNNSFLKTSYVNGGIVRIKPGGMVKNLIVNSGTLIVEAGATAEYVTMKKGTHLTVFTGGSIRDLIMWGEIGTQLYPGAMIEMMPSKTKNEI